MMTGNENVEGSEITLSESTLLKDSNHIRFKGSTGRMLMDRTVTQLKWKQFLKAEV